MHIKPRLFHTRQGGAVAVTVALVIVVLMGFAGLVVDLGRLFVAKAELQNAADACALAAADSLSSKTQAGLQAGATAGTYVASQHRVVFQGDGVGEGTTDPIVVTFGTALDDQYGNYKSASDLSGNAASGISYVKCSVRKSSIINSFMHFFGFQGMTVSAIAKASLTPSSTACILPVGFCCADCSSSAAPGFGFTVGKWYEGRITASNPDSEDMASAGSFRWIAFPSDGVIDKQASNPGASNLAKRLVNEQCDTGYRSTTVTSAPGQMAKLDLYFNTKFGIYANGINNIGFVPTPDPSGFAYVEPGFASESSPDSTAYVHYRDTARPGNFSYQGDSDTGLVIFNKKNPDGTSVAGGTIDTFLDTPAELLGANQTGISKRLVSLPIVKCSDLSASGQSTDILGFACMLALHPIGDNGSEVQGNGLPVTVPGPKNCQCDTVFNSSNKGDKAGDCDGGEAALSCSSDGSEVTNYNCSREWKTTGSVGYTNKYSCDYTPPTKDISNLMRLEFVDSGGVTSACSSSGQPGGVGSLGPKVKSLVQ